MSSVRRRQFITLIGGAAIASPLAARAQQVERVRRIGLLMGTADDPEGQARVTALKQGLQELGWIDGRNIQIETRFGGADAGRIRAHAAELVALAPDVLVGHTTPGTQALRQATSSIPIVMVAVNDPVEQGFVSSLAHPGATCRQLARHTGTLKPKCCPKTPQRKVLRDTECSHSWARRGSCIAPGFLAP